jgi:hypothetical protein
VQRFSLGELDENKFAELWQACEPFVLVGVADPATPETILELNKDNPHPCTTSFHDGKTWVDNPDTTLEQFFGIAAPQDVRSKVVPCSNQIRVRRLLISFF